MSDKYTRTNLKWGRQTGCSETPCIDYAVYVSQMLWGTGQEGSRPSWLETQQVPRLEQYDDILKRKKLRDYRKNIPGLTIIGPETHMYFSHSENQRSDVLDMAILRKQCCAVEIHSLWGIIRPQPSGPLHRQPNKIARRGCHPTEDTWKLTADHFSYPQRWRDRISSEIPGNHHPGDRGDEQQRVH